MFEWNLFVLELSFLLAKVLNEALVWISLIFLVGVVR